MLSVFTSCTAVYQGYPLKNIDNSKLSLNTSTKQDVRLQFGTPTFSFKNIDCYIEAKGYKFMFLRFANPKYNSICLKYDKYNVLQEIINKQNDNLVFKKDDNPSFKLSLAKPK